MWLVGSPRAYGIIRRGGRGILMIPGQHAGSPLAMDAAQPASAVDRAGPGPAGLRAPHSVRKTGPSVLGWGTAPEAGCAASMASGDSTCCPEIIGMTARRGGAVSGVPNNDPGGVGAPAGSPPATYRHINKKIFFFRFLVAGPGGSVPGLRF